MLDVPRSAKALPGPRSSPIPSLRSANLTVESVSADRTTADAQAMGIKGLVASYQTFYGGDPNRIHNVQLVSHLVDNHVIAPGEDVLVQRDDRASAPRTRASSRRR